MRELIEGVTKIRWTGKDNPDVRYSLWENREGTYIGTIDGTLRWKSPEGVDFIYCDRVNLWHDGDFEFVGEDESQEVQSLTKLKEDIEVIHETLGAKVKSTGSSSDYYKIVLPEWLLLKQKDNGFIMLEDLAEIMFDNDFNYVNVMKAQKRMFDLEGGRGKEGNTFEYDATKCKYYIDKQVEVFNREQENK